ncbi:RNA polymerase sigma factor [bacterium]|nr:RNA polymerase sigma factor [bacterium]
MKEEEILLKKVKKGDLDSFEELFNKYCNLVQSRIRKLLGNNQDVEDLVQDTFFKAFKYIGSFNPQKSRFSTWISTIAHNVTVDYIRKNFKVTIYSVDTFYSPEDELPVSDGHEPADTYKQKSEYETMLFCVSCLDKKYRQVVELRYLQDMNYKEIAASLNIPMGTVMTRLFRAKEKLVQIATKYGARDG